MDIIDERHALLNKTSSLLDNCILLPWNVLLGSANLCRVVMPVAPYIPPTPLTPAWGSVC